MGVFALLVLALVVVGLPRGSLSVAEAHAAWLVQSASPRDLLARVQADGQAPLYFALLKGWTLAAGDTPLALRIPSLWAGLIGLAAAYGLFRRRGGWLLLATAAFVIMAAREAHLAALLLALTALATLLYRRWREMPGMVRGLLYGLAGAALLLTHLLGWLVIGAHLIHWLLMGRRGRWWILLPYALAGAPFALWLVISFKSLRDHLDLAALLPPLSFPSVALVVAGLMLLAALSHRRTVSRVALLALVVAQAALLLARPLEPAWDVVLRRIDAERAPLEPLVTAFAPDSPAAYYERLYGLRRGIRLEIGWRAHTPDEVRALADALRDETDVWMVLPADSAADRVQMVAALGAERGIETSFVMEGVLVYHFRAGAP
jgi:hypothetical protein